MILNIPYLDHKFIDWTREIIADLIDAKINFISLNTIEIGDEDHEGRIPIRIRFLYNDFVKIPEGELSGVEQGINHTTAYFNRSDDTLAYLLTEDFIEKLNHKLQNLQLISEPELQRFEIATQDNIFKIRKLYERQAHLIDAVHFDRWGYDWVLRANIDAEITGYLFA